MSTYQRPTVFITNPDFPRTPPYRCTDPHRIPVSRAGSIDDPELKIELNVRNIQGDVLVGFNKPYSVLLGFVVTGPGFAKAWLETAVRNSITSAFDVMAFRDEFRKIRAERGSKVEALKVMKPQTCLNVAFSSQGLGKLLGKHFTAETFSDPNFKADLEGSYLELNDPAPDTWKVGHGENRLDIIIQIASDSLDALRAKQKELLGAAGVELKYQENGYRNPQLPGQEQFGFLDGIGQPAFRGMYVDANLNKNYFSGRTISKIDSTHNNYSFPGINLVWPGEFIFGYTQPDSLNPVKPATTVQPFWGKFPDWAKDGSLMVFRRLQQDVPMFWNFVHKNAADKTIFPKGISDDELASRLVGRWPSGAPLMRSFANDTAGMTELSTSNFFYSAAKSPTPLIALGDKPDSYPVAQGDPTGYVCPFAGHIRKMQPRDSTDENPLFHRIIRRGSPYGDFIEDRYTEDKKDRGLLFVAYSASIHHGFEFLQTAWANNENRPKAGGSDFIMGQPNGERRFLLQVPCENNGTTSYQSVTLRADKDELWVKPTGGGYFFVPPIDFFNPNSILFKN